MSMDMSERMTVDDAVYAIYTFPLEPYRKSLPSPPRFRGWPGCSNGYRATWAIQEHGPDRVLCLTDVRPYPQEVLAALSLPAALPLAATWFSGIIRGSRGERRRAGYPPREIHPDEIYIEVAAGKVVREWLLDLRAVPDQTEEEWRQSVPSFLWKFYPQAASGRSPAPPA